MKYRLTILNGAAFLFLAGCIIFTVFNYSKMAAGEGWGVVYMVGLSVFGLTALVVDFIIQLIFKRKDYRENACIIALAVYIALYFLFTS